MNFTKEIFKRATIRGVADYLLYGFVPSKEGGSYEERLDQFYLEYEQLVLQCSEEKHFELLNKANAMASESASVYTEIGIQAGILLMKDIIHNINAEQGKRTQCRGVGPGRQPINNARDLLALAAESMEARAVNERLVNDAGHQKKLEEESKVLQAMLGLTVEQGACVDALIASKNQQECNQYVSAYRAGMLDAYELLKACDGAEE